ncbi:unnamed protein product [Camellia sinensis]
MGYYTASVTRKTGDDEVVLMEINEEDKTVGEALNTISRGVHDKGHSVTMKRTSDGKKSLRDLKRLGKLMLRICPLTGTAGSICLRMQGLDFVIDAGVRVADPSTVVDMIGSFPRIIRQGKGPKQPWMNEEDLSYMFDETTPVKACGDLAYHVADNVNMDKELQQCTEMSSQVKRRRMLQFDNEILGSPLCNEEISSVFLKSKEREDSLEEALSDMSHWVSGFEEETSATGHEGLDQSSEGWLADCFNNDEMHCSPDDLKVRDLVEASNMYGTLNNVLDVDVKNDTVRTQGSLSCNLRRVRQGLDLIRAIFEFFLSSEYCSLKEAASEAYAQVCAPYHTWAVRTAVYAGMCALPTWEQLLLKLNENGEIVIPL